jgi:hypothetical protein
VPPNQAHGPESFWLSCSGATPVPTGCLKHDLSGSKLTLEVPHGKTTFGCVRCPDSQSRAVSNRPTKHSDIASTEPSDVLGGRLRVPADRASALYVSEPSLNRMSPRGSESLIATSKGPAREGQPARARRLS